MSDSTVNRSYEVIVIGSGPAGQKAAIQAAKAGKRVALVEMERKVGGACVHRGTIPSKTLRETALQLATIRASGGNLRVQLAKDVEVATLMRRLSQVTNGHSKYMGDQLERNGVDLITGRANFVGPKEIQVNFVRGPAKVFAADTIIVGTGSRPRLPDDIPIDHEHILDSDSILSMFYLPRSLTVLGAGVIASEYASIFAALGVHVTIVDKGPRPLAFMDHELSAAFVHAFEREGHHYLPGRDIQSVVWDGVESVVTTLASGEVIRSDKLLCALGRVANVAGLTTEAAGIELTKRGHIKVDEHCESNVPGVYGVGDVIGHPALASTSMEQGRRAMCHALGLPKGQAPELIPIGIYTIPEMSSVGLNEEQAIERYGSCTVGRASYSEVARGQIQNDEDGMLKLIADPKGERLLGAHIIGTGACELIHVAQVALISEWSIESFVENIFNFPTLAEAYRIAALDLINRGRRAHAEDEQASRASA